MELSQSILTDLSLVQDVCSAFEVETLPFVSREHVITTFAPSLDYM